MQELEDRLTINGTEFVIQWFIDVDSPYIECCSVDTPEGSCIFWALDIAVKAKIKRFLDKRMSEMAQAAKDERRIAAYENKQWNNMGDF